MRDEGFPHPSSLLPHPSSLIPHPSSLIPHPSSLIPHPSSLIPHPSSLIPHPLTCAHQRSRLPPRVRARRRWPADSGEEGDGMVAWRTLVSLIVVLSTTPAGV